MVLIIEFVSENGERLRWSRMTSEPARAKSATRTMTFIVLSIASGVLDARSEKFES